MRISISNIAWDPHDDQAVYALLVKNQLDAIDVAPGKYFTSLANATNAEIERVRSWWGERGIEITGMQALLFGTSGLNVFGNEASRHRTLEHLESVCRIGSVLGAKFLVFGSPRNRDRTGLEDLEALDRATAFFREAGSIAERAGVVLCLEPNPRSYGANFMTTTAETAIAVRAINHSAVRMQFDTGAALMNGEDIESSLANAAELIAHVHASEPHLVPIGTANSDHAAIARSVRAHLPNRTVCIEMLPPKTEDHLAAIDRAINETVQRYSTSAQQT